MRRRDADPLAEQRQARDAAVVAQDLEHRERPPQQRIAAAAGLDHDELARAAAAAISGAASAMTL